MRIAILGSGRVGGALATGWSKANHEVVIAAREPKSKNALATASECGAPILPVGEACQSAEVILLAVPWPAVSDAIKAAGDTSGKVVLDANNALRRDWQGLDLPPGTSGAEIVQSLAPEASVVKIFNTIGAQHMRDAGGLTMFYAGDNLEAKAKAAQLAKDVRFDPVDAGPLSMALSLEYLAYLWISLASRGGIGPDFGLGIVRG